MVQRGVASAIGDARIGAEGAEKRYVRAAPVHKRVVQRRAAAIDVRRRVARIDRCAAAHERLDCGLSSRALACGCKVERGEAVNVQRVRVGATIEQRPQPQHVPCRSCSVQLPAVTACNISRSSTWLRSCGSQAGGWFADDAPGSVFIICIDCRSRDARSIGRA